MTDESWTSLITDVATILGGWTEETAYGLAALIEPHGKGGVLWVITHDGIYQYESYLRYQENEPPNAHFTLADAFIAAVDRTMKDQGNGKGKTGKEHKT